MRLSDVSLVIIMIIQTPTALQLCTVIPSSLAPCVMLFCEATQCTREQVSKNIAIRRVKWQMLSCLSLSKAIELLEIFLFSYVLSKNYQALEFYLCEISLLAFLAVPEQKWENCFTAMRASKNKSHFVGGDIVIQPWPGCNYLGLIVLPPAQGSCIPHLQHSPQAPAIPLVPSSFEVTSVILSFSVFYHSLPLSALSVTVHGGNCG